MIDNRIHIDDSLPAILRCAGRSIDCATVQEAVLAFQRLPEIDREEATVTVNGSATYTANEIGRLYRRKPK
jgi:hypothetical protein